MSTTVIVRNFTGRSDVLQVDTSSKVSEVKEEIARRLGKKAKPSITLRGHELRDHQTLSYYGVSNNQVLSILPPSNAPKTLLHFETTNGHHFKLEVNTSMTIAQLKQDVAIEKNITVDTLKCLLSPEDGDDLDAHVVSEASELPDHALISDYPLTDTMIFICGPPPPAMPPSSFDVQVRLRDGRMLRVETNYNQTLKELRSAMQLQHQVSIEHDVLIFVGRELTGEDRPLWDLDIVPECTIHAVVPFVSLNVEITWRHMFKATLFHPLTRLSAVRKQLEQNLPPGLSLDNYWFTIDRKEHLKDSRNLWDLDLVSDVAKLYMRTSVISVTVAPHGDSTPIQLDVEEDETVWGLKERWALVSGMPISDRDRMFYRDKILDDAKTLREEGLVGGEQLKLRSISQKAHERLGLNFES